MGDDAIQFDTLLELCRDPHRRIALAVLADQQRPLTVNDLTKTISKHNHHRPITDASDDELKQIRISLYHHHLPKLAEVGLVDWDPKGGRVEPTAQLDQIHPQLSAIMEADPELEAPVVL